MRCYEIYSQNGDPGITGGVDPTNETLRLFTNNQWSIMATGEAEDTRFVTNAPRPQTLILILSLEELSTVDFRNIPSETERDQE